MHSSTRPRPRSAERRRRFSSNTSSRRPSHGHSSFRGRGRTSARSKKQQPTFNPAQFINKNPAPLEPEVYTPDHTFADFGLDRRIVDTLQQLDLVTPTPIQDQIIPQIMQGRDVIGLAATGTGKTAAFLLPLIHASIAQPHRQTLILTPTRELAIQIEHELQKLSKGLRLHAVTCVGGVGIKPQIQALRRRNQFIIGTPGRIMDLIERRNFNPAKVSTVILDEADRMLDMGFINDMRSILGGTPNDRETLFFSATMTKEAEKLVHDFLRDPVTVSVKKTDVTTSVEQDIVPFYHDAKFDTLVTLLQKSEFERVMIFGAMKRSVETLAKQLTQAGIRAESIHGNKTHSQRQRALSNFKRGFSRVLVATDVAARGIHVDSVSHVINYDLPNTFEDYVHRIGRTGRGIHSGKALTFVPAKLT